MSSFAGLLVSADSYMNFQLADTDEFIEGSFRGTLGEVLVRCNNVLYVRAGDESDEAERQARRGNAGSADTAAV